ncbi:MAG TPA: MerR family transcriptional regulator [Acidobacteriaceae bacterium]|nr:MerR family transcriptional regulator [Acidobacteriaceae bacterium]
MSCISGGFGSILGNTMAKPALPKHSSSKHAVQEVVVPDKLYFRIGDVAKLLGVETYVLRFWESEFPQMRPNKSGTGQRLYRKRDVELAVRVRNLLHGQGYTIAGARQVLSGEHSRARTPQLPLLEKPATVRITDAKIAKLRGELKELLGILSGAPSRAERKPRAANAPGPRLFE